MSKLIEEDRKLISNLEATTKQYLDLKKERAKTAKQLYDEFLKKYIFQFSKDKSKCAEELKEFFKKDRLRIVAVDGTLYKRSRRGCLAFYVLAAPLVYELDLNSQKIYRIEEEMSKKNVMALMPIPVSEIFLLGSNVVEEEGSEHKKLSEEELEIEEGIGEAGDTYVFESLKIGKIDLKLMKLAEVYALYWSACNLKPDIMMYDGSLFKDYSFSNREVDKINLYKGKILGHKFEKEFFEIFKACPINEDLRIPSPHFTKNFITAEVISYGKVELRKVNSSFEFHSKLVNEKILLTKRKIENLKQRKYFDFEEDDESIVITLKKEYKGFLDKLKELFLKVCNEGFDKHNLDAFKIFLDSPTQHYRYFSEEDIDTLCRIGYLLIMEKCWGSNILLFSIIKDTTERIFIDYFLTISGPRHVKEFKFDDKLLPMIPSTDAGMIFDISHHEPNLHPPLASMEFDPAVSAVYSRYNLEEKKFELISARGIQEREFLRTFVQISESESGRKSYVYTIDRLMYPSLDKEYKLLDVSVPSREYKFAYYDGSSEILRMIINILRLTSSDRHDMVFGYPDPLYEVDQYVKTIGRTHLETLDIALTEIDLDEFSVTYRMGRMLGGG